MPYTDPTLRSTGDLITASIYNTDIISDIIALHTGALALSSGASLDFIYSATATQLGRVAKVTGAFPRVTAAGSGWEMHRLSYVPTLAQVLNTAAKTTAVSCTVPAGDLSDGSTITMQVAALCKNNKGTSGTVLFGVSYAGVADVSPTNGVPTWINDATEFSCIYRFTLMRVGTALWVVLAAFPTGGGADQIGALPELFFNLGPADTTGGAITGGNTRAIAAPNFAADQTLAINVTLSAADANFYIKPQSAQIRRGTV